MPTEDERQALGQHPQDQTQNRVPHLGDKIRAILQALGRTQGWLAGHLGVTPPNISMWAQSERPPSRHVATLCRVAGIDRAALFAPTMPEFQRALDEVFSAGSGRPWHALVQQRIERYDGLKVAIEREPGERPVGNLSFRPPEARAQSGGLPNVRVDQRVRLVITDTSLRALRDEAGQPYVALNFVLACEDKHGWQVVCPSPHRTGFEQMGELWKMPPEGTPALYLHEPVGPWLAVAVVCAMSIPPAIIEDLRRNEAGSLTSFDHFALWLRSERSPHVVLGCPFIVTPARKAYGP